ncbi:MAG: hypothetical protein KA129_06935 [Microthrixaceae bacterium]|nr:hypothetical protein [Microthrixaceae bacterium]
MWALIVAVVLIVFVLPVALVARWWTWKPVIKQRVLVQTDFDVTFSGVILSRRGQLLVLGDVTVGVAGGDSRRADGVVIVERARVTWMQVA